MSKPMIPRNFEGAPPDLSPHQLVLVKSVGGLYATKIVGDLSWHSHGLGAIMSYRVLTEKETAQHFHNERAKKYWHWW